VEQEAPETDEAPPDDIYAEDDPAPEAAEAPDVYEALSDDPVEIPGTWTIPDKDGSTSPGGGYTSSKGRSKTAVHNRRARPDGRPGGRGKSDGGGARRTPKNLARAARPSSLSWGDCPFPPQADLEQVDRATAVVAVTVAPNGSPRSVQVLSDPGYGFGAMAKRCAMSKSYTPALDADGKKITATTPPINVRFRR
jgi:protein TonB